MVLAEELTLAKAKRARNKKSRRKEYGMPSEPYDPWSDRPDRERARPTPERKGKGEFRLISGENAGAAYALDDAPTPVRDCYFRGKISRGQMYAGERFEALARSQVSTGPRSCLDWMPRSTGEAETEYQMRQYQAWREIVAELGMERSYVLIEVCVLHHGTGDRRPQYRRWSRFIEALEVCRVRWGSPHEDS